jgi:hypothetical protein
VALCVPATAALTRTVPGRSNFGRSLPFTSSSLRLGESDQGAGPARRGRSDAAGPAAAPSATAGPGAPSAGVPAWRQSTDRLHPSPTALRALCEDRSALVDEWNVPVRTERADRAVRQVAQRRPTLGRVAVPVTGRGPVRALAGGTSIWCAGSLGEDGADASPVRLRATDRRGHHLRLSRGRGERAASQRSQVSRRF